jgi:hypothetical protein
VIEGAKPGQSTRNCGGRRSGEPAGARYLEEVAGFQRRTCGAQLGSTGGRKSWNPQQMGPRWEGYGGGPSGGRRAGRWMWMSWCLEAAAGSAAGRLTFPRATATSGRYFLEDFVITR